VLFCLNHVYSEKIGEGESIMLAIQSKIKSVSPLSTPTFKIKPLSSTTLPCIQSQFGDRLLAEARSNQAKQHLRALIHRQVEGVMTALLSLVPKQRLRNLESTNLFAGHYMPDLKTSVAKAKKAHPEMRDMLNQVEEVCFSALENPFIKNYGWYIPAKKDKPTILHAMGNKSSLTSILRYQPLIDDGFGFMAYEYPGYGRTPGKPTEENLYQSAAAASHFLQKQKGIPQNKQVFHGMSLGGAITAELASRNSGVKAVILESTMTSFPDVARVKVENYVPSWLFPLHKVTFSQMTSLQKMPAIKAPLLVLHG
jgi:hypothetical protein